MEESRLLTGLEQGSLSRIVLMRRSVSKNCAEGVADDARHPHSSQFNNREREMHQLIYLVGLIVVILAILSFFGLR